MLGYEPRADSPDEDLVDGRDRGTSFWFEQMEAPRPDGGGAIHIAVWVPQEQAEAGVASALAAGGHLVRDDFAPAWWTLADAAGNEAAVAPSAAATEGPAGNCVAGCPGPIAGGIKGIVIDDWRTMIRRPSAWLPMAVSLAALVFLVGYVAMVGETGGAGRDEGAPARIFQVLMVAEAVLIVAFAIRWLPRAPRSTVAIMVVQVVVAAIPIAAVTLLEAGI